MYPVPSFTELSLIQPVLCGIERVVNKAPVGSTTPKPSESLSMVIQHFLFLIDICHVNVCFYFVKVQLAR